MQLFTAQAICSLSSSSTSLASSALGIWVDRSPDAVPKNLSEEIAKLRKKTQPDTDELVSEPGENEETI